MWILQKPSFIFQRTLKRAGKSYRAFVERVVNPENPLLNLTKGILGDEQFVAGVRDRVDDFAFDEEIPRAQRPTVDVPVEAVNEKVAAMYGQEKDEITRRGKEKPGREAAVYAAKVLTGKTNREIGSFFGVKGAAVSEIIKRVESRVAQDENLRQKIIVLRNDFLN